MSFNRFGLGLDIMFYNEQELKELNENPFLQSIYRNSIKDDEKDEKDNEKIYTEDELHRSRWDKKQKVKCSFCGEIYTRSNKSQHNKSKLHQAYLNINKKFRKLLIDK